MGAGEDDPSPEYPHGRLNPAAPPETSQYAFMVGQFDCTLAYKEYRDGAWAPSKEGRATWNARFIMNGQAILDEFRDEWGDTNVDVRVFDAEKGTWRVHYTTANPGRGMAHEATEVDGRMVMLTPRQTPGGSTYTERVTFTPQGTDAYRWTQEIVYSESSAVLMGDILCRRR
jgi:hypothetical protein